MLATIALSLLCQCPSGQCPRVLVEPVYRVGAPARPVVYASPSSPPPTVRHASLPRAAAFPPKQWVWLTKQGVWGFGWQRWDGLWVIDPGSKRPPAPVPAPAPSPAPLPSQGDPFGFGAWLNEVRRQASRPPLAYDPSLAAWAAQNNVYQQSRGMGHWYMGGASGQCAAWGQSSALQAGQDWLGDPPHREILMGGYSYYGIAQAGPFWTLDVR